MDFVIRWASGKIFVRFVTIMTMRKLGFNMVFYHNFQRRYKSFSFISCCACFGGEEFRSWHFDDFGRFLGLILVLSEIVIREICQWFSRPFLFAVPFCCLSFCLYSWEGRGGGAVVPLTLFLYVASVVPLGGKEDLCDGVSSVCALGPVVCRICWRFLERCRCFLRVLELARGFVVSQQRGCCELVPLAEW
jgi:hypothetical protein